MSERGRWIRLLDWLQYGDVNGFHSWVPADEGFCDTIIDCGGALKRTHVDRLIGKENVLFVYERDERDALESFTRSAPSSYGYEYTVKKCGFSVQYNPGSLVFQSGESPASIDYEHDSQDYHDDDGELVNQNQTLNTDSDSDSMPRTLDIETLKSSKINPNIPNNATIGEVDDHLRSPVISNKHQPNPSTTTYIRRESCFGYDSSLGLDDTLPGTTPLNVTGIDLNTLSEDIQGLQFSFSTVHHSHDVDAGDTPNESSDFQSLPLPTTGDRFETPLCEGICDGEEDENHHPRCPRHVLFSRLMSSFANDDDLDGHTQLGATANDTSLPVGECQCEALRLRDPRGSFSMSSMSMSLPVPFPGDLNVPLLGGPIGHGSSAEWMSSVTENIMDSIRRPSLPRLVDNRSSLSLRSSALLSDDSGSLSRLSPTDVRRVKELRGSVTSPNVLGMSNTGDCLSVGNISPMLRRETTKLERSNSSFVPLVDLAMDFETFSSPSEHANITNQSNADLCKPNHDQCSVNISPWALDPRSPETGDVSGRRNSYPSPLTLSDDNVDIDAESHLSSSISQEVERDGLHLQTFGTENDTKKFSSVNEEVQKTDRRKDADNITEMRRISVEDTNSNTPDTGSSPTLKLNYLNASHLNGQVIGYIKPKKELPCLMRLYELFKKLARSQHAFLVAESSVNEGPFFVVAFISVAMRWHPMKSLRWLQLYQPDCPVFIEKDLLAILIDLVMIESYRFGQRWFRRLRAGPEVEGEEEVYFCETEGMLRQSLTAKVSDTNLTLILTPSYDIFTAFCGGAYTPEAAQVFSRSMEDFRNEREILLTSSALSARTTNTGIAVIQEGKKKRQAWLNEQSERQLAQMTEAGCNREHGCACSFCLSPVEGWQGRRYVLPYGRDYGYGDPTSDEIETDSDIDTEEYETFRNDNEDKDDLRRKKKVRFNNSMSIQYYDPSRRMGRCI